MPYRATFGGYPAHPTPWPLPGASLTGCEVVIRGLHDLLRSDEFTGVVHSYDHTRGRYVILLDSDV